MASVIVPTPRQTEVRDANELDLLVIAPAGCGKTEALALRVQGLLDREVVVSPRRVLVATFTNRARDNIRERLRAYLSPSQLRDLVSVQNFHGLSARIYSAHASAIGLDPAWLMPDGDWVGSRCQELRLTGAQRSIVQTALRDAKQDARTDEEVLEFLDGAGSPTARAIEVERQRRRQLTYDDLPRLTELVLANQVVADLYANHFGAVVVDEFQDLTPQQLRIVQRVGRRRTTFGGDLAQGIYRFAGADPIAVLADVRTGTSRTIEFSESHRSSPAILAAVNAFAPAVGGVLLTCAAQGSWPHGGVTGQAGFPHPDDEARWIIEFAKARALDAPTLRIGVISRSQYRRRFLDAAVTSEADLVWHRWDDPLMDGFSAPILRTVLNRADWDEYEDASSPVDYLWSLAEGHDLQDPSTRQAVGEGIAWAVEGLNDGALPADLIARVKATESGSLLSAPGLHLLTAHTGKGQQFDWVFVMGLEDGTIPDYRALTAEDVREELCVLSVMVSRARHGAVLTAVGNVPWPSGDPNPKTPSPFLRHLVVVPTHLEGVPLGTWFSEADWTAIAVR